MVALTPVMKNIILHWGEMGSSWGINRTVAQIYVLLYLSPDPLTADEISASLAIARSTVSTGLHELQGWGLVKVTHVLGDRRDHFTTLNDIWEVFRVILAERKRREIDPTLEFLHESVEEMQNQTPDDVIIAERITEMLDFFVTVNGVYEKFENIPTKRLKELFRRKSLFSNIVEQLVGD